MYVLFLLLYLFLFSSASFNCIFILIIHPPSVIFFHILWFSVVFFFFLLNSNLNFVSEFGVTRISWKFSKVNYPLITFQIYGHLNLNFICDSLFNLFCLWRSYLPINFSLTPQAPIVFNRKIFLTLSQRPIFYHHKP